jgi:hypothetical protein
MTLARMVEQLAAGKPCLEAAAALIQLSDALEFYADPENYHAVAFMADRPAGAFADDFSSDYEEFTDICYGRDMPGKYARHALRLLTEER